MQSTISFKSDNVYDLLQRMEDTRQALKGFEVLLDIALHSGGGDLKSYGFGIGQLLDGQIYDLEQIEDALRQEFNVLKGSKLEVADIDYIARLTNLRRAHVERVLWVAVGYKGEQSLPVNSGRVHPTLTRDVRIWLLSRLLSGEKEIAEIAERSGVSAETVGAVLNSAMEYDMDANDGEEQTMEHQPLAPDAAAIASELNLKVATVEKVLERAARHAEPPAARTGTEG